MAGARAEAVVSESGEYVGSDSRGEWEYVGGAAAANSGSMLAATAGERGSMLAALRQGRVGACWRVILPDQLSTLWLCPGHMVISVLQLSLSFQFSELQNDIQEH